MPIDPELLRTVERAVADRPDDVPLRLHLADLLLDDGQFAAALGHCERILRDHPTEQRAAERALQARRGLGASGEFSDRNEARTHETRPDSAPSLDELVEITRPEVTLADVAGMEGVKERLREVFLEPLKHEEVRRAFGQRLRAGFLLWGPPGCGKTYIARALAGELGLFFVHVGIADVLDIWTGSSERNIRQVFEHARAMAPTLLFIDELDALGHRRAGLRHNVGARNVVNQLLIELDGAATENEGLLILGATNQPWDVDSALLRPGRFDEQLIVLPPDAAARRAILERGFDAVPTDRLDLDPVVQRTEVYSGADLASICSRAAQSAMTRSVAAGHVQPVTQQDLMAATAAVAPSTDNWLRSAENFIEFSNDSRYDVLARYLAKLKRRR